MIDVLVDKFRLFNCKCVSTPAEMDLLKRLSDDLRIAKNVPHREIIGCLLYIAGSTRPGIRFVTNILSCQLLGRS